VTSLLVEGKGHKVIVSSKECAALVADLENPKELSAEILSELIGRAEVYKCMLV
jgi:hypothetical protein